MPELNFFGPKGDATIHVVERGALQVVFGSSSDPAVGIRIESVEYLPETADCAVHTPDGSTHHVSFRNPSEAQHFNDLVTRTFL